MTATLSIVIPAWTGSPELAQMATDLIHQVEDDCDELIVCEDGGGLELRDVCDQIKIARYFWHPNLGDTCNTVQGMFVAIGDFIAVINTDVIIHEGSIRDLCIPGRIVCPKWRQLREQTGFNASLFVADRQVLDQYGYYDISKKKGADYDYAARIKEVYEWSDRVEYTHLAGRSYSEMRRQADEASRSNPNI